MPSLIAKTRNGIGRGNTKVWNDNGIFAVQLHDTIVYHETPGHVLLDNGGWVTQTTARRMNQALIHRGINGRVRIIRGQMFFQRESFSTPFIGSSYDIQLGAGEGLIQ